MPKRHDETNDQSDQADRTEVIPQPPDHTAGIAADDTARMPSAADTSAAPSAVAAPPWAAAVDGAAAAAPAGLPGPAPVAVAVPTTGSPWWRGRLVLAGGALAAGLLLGGAVGATAAVAIDGDDRVAEVGEEADGGRGGFDGQGRPPGGRHGGGRGEGRAPGLEGPLPGGGQEELPGGGTSTDPSDPNDADDANGTDQGT